MDRHSQKSSDHDTPARPEDTGHSHTHSEHGLTCEALAIGPGSNDEAPGRAVFSRDKAGAHFEALQAGVSRHPLCIAGQLKGAPRQGHRQHLEDELRIIQPLQPCDPLEKSLTCWDVTDDWAKFTQAWLGSAWLGSH